MDVNGRTLVILLSMHRSGSSLTASVLQRLGMSLGPFELLGASPSNPHGHFEAVTICELNRKVQSLFHGFMDDMPETEDGLQHFLATEGSWDATREMPEEFLQEGREIVSSLLTSGMVSGFKDPRTILTWPFWRRVLESFPGVRVVPLALLRSPHPIAMSLCTRSEGGYGYWACLDVVSVHFRRLQAIIREWDAPVPLVRFGTDLYLEDLAGAALSCGLDWDVKAACGNIDEDCIHHAAATVAHEAQVLYQAMAGSEHDPRDFAMNQGRLAADERAREILVGKRLSRLLGRLDAAEREGHRTRIRLDQVSTEAAENRDQVRRALDRLREAEELLLRSRAEAEELLRTRAEAEGLLLRTRAEAEERLVRSRAEAEELRSRLAQFETHRILGRVLRGRR